MKRTAIVLALAALCSPAFGAILFQEDFESGLGANWAIIGSAQVVADPLQADNALHFTAPGSGGDLFSTVIAAPAGTYYLQFDYLSTADISFATPGGFVGIMDPLETWLVGDANYAATIQTNAVPRNAWQHVDLTFSTNGNFLLKLEQFAGSSAPIGTAYFDNILITTETPEPSTMAMVGLALAGVGAFRQSKSKSKANS